MALIAVAVHDTEENKKTECTKRTLESLFDTVDFGKHRLFIIDNNSCYHTQKLYQNIGSGWCKNSAFKMHNLPVLISNQENIGTARAINKAWAYRNPGEHCVKIDNDIVIHSGGWADEMEECIERDSSIGQIGLKRKDCWETPWEQRTDYRSQLKMLPHEPGQKWKVVEQVKHVIGSCVMHSSALLDKVGYLYQPGLYGYDDVIMSHRSYKAGFYSCFLPHVEIDHIDNGGTEYQGWKERHAGEHTQQVIDLVHEMLNGTKSIYYEQY